MTDQTEMKPALVNCLNELGNAADRLRTRAFLNFFGPVLAGQWDAGMRLKFERRFHLHESHDRARHIRELLKYDAERRRQGLDFFTTNVERWRMCGLLVVEGRAMRADRKIAERFAMRSAAE